MHYLKKYYKSTVKAKRFFDFFKHPAPIDGGGRRYCHLKKDNKNTVKPNHFFVILKHSAPIDAGYSVTTFGKLTGKQSKINMNFGHFQRFSAHKLGGRLCTIFCLN